MSRFIAGYDCDRLARSIVAGEPYVPPELDELYLTAGEAADTAADIVARARRDYGLASLRGEAG